MSRASRLSGLAAAAACALLPIMAAAETHAADGAADVRATITRIAGANCTLSSGADDGLAVGQSVYAEGETGSVELIVRSTEPGTSVAVPRVPETLSVLVVGDTVSSRRRVGRLTSPLVQAQLIAPAVVPPAPQRPRPAPSRTAVVVRAQGERLWLSAGEEAGINRGMVGALTATEDPVRILVVESSPRSAEARVIPDMESPTENTVTVGAVIEGIAFTSGEPDGVIAALRVRGARRNATKRFDPALGAQGSTGLINVPTAETARDGTLALGYNQLQGYNAVTRQQGRLRVHSLTVGFLPRLEITGRFVRRSIPTGNPNLDKLDRSANFKIQPFDETLSAPAIAFGVEDIAGNRLNRAVYLVGSKQFGPSRVHVGYGRDRLDGIFLGAETKLTPNAALMAEWQSDQINSGMRFRLGERMDLSAYFFDMRDLRFGVSYRSPLGDRDASEHIAIARRYRPSPGTRGDWAATIGNVSAALVERDFEDVQPALVDSAEARFPGLTLLVDYTDRSRPRTPLDGLSEALLTVAVNCPEDIRNLSIVVKSRDVPVLCFTTRTDDYFKFVNGEISAAMYRSRISVRVAPATGRAARRDPVLSRESAPANRSYFRTDLSLTPELIYDLGAPADIFRTKLSGIAAASMSVGPGTTLDFSFARPAWTEFETLGQRRDFHVRRAAVSHLRRVGHSAFARAEAGYLRQGTYGLAAEGLNVFGEGRTSLGLQAVALGVGLGDLRHRSGLLDARYRFPELDLTASLKYGRFLGTDTGWELALDRRLGHHRLGIFGARTDFGSYGGIRLRLPMGPSRYGRPAPFRAHLGDQFFWSYQSNPDQDRGKKLVTGDELEDAILEDERLYPVYVLEHLERLRNVEADRG